jgi:hypothetical protein
MGLSLNWAAGMLLCTLGGVFLDRKTGGGYGWTLGGMFMGLLYGAYETWKVIRALNRQERDDDTRRHPSTPP